MPPAAVQPSNSSIPTIAYSMFRQACSSDATLWTSSLVAFARPTRILYTRLMERPRLFRTQEFSPGVRAQEAKLPNIRGWTSSLSGTKRLLRYTFSSIQNSRSSAPHETIGCERAVEGWIRSPSTNIYPTTEIPLDRPAFRFNTKPYG